MAGNQQESTVKDSHAQVAKESNQFDASSGQAQACQKKDMTRPMQDSYHPQEVESGWYQWWEAQGYLKPRVGADGQLPADCKGVYVVPVPPPNVTGSLHLGHALTGSIQDSLVRWHRMRGFSVLYNPGCDHAGISTQVVVEKKLWKEQKLTRHDLGREEFIKKVFEWKEEYGNRIYGQQKRLGSSLDWSRATFTMDPKFVNAVTETFVRLHDEGIIYRDTKLVNWCCKLNTALSNLEVENKDLEGKTLMHVPGHDENRKYEFGTIVSFAYPIDGSDSDEKIVVATTRLETMLGDSAIAVHPQDARYKHLAGKFAKHPFNNRLIPIIQDEMVDMEFGTGAVKITPAHDPNDYQVGKKHNLEFINILNDDGLLNANGYPFEGLKRFDARVEVLKALKTKGLYIETKPNKMVLPICSRTGDVVEPMLKPQWYVNCQDMAKDAIQVVKDGRLNIRPKSSEKEWFQWMENIQDWCISRQLWWGHTIPAYFIRIDGKEDLDQSDGNYWVSGRTVDEAMLKAEKKFPEHQGKISLQQDPDVLDTWFSSALWPFAMLGWPEKTRDLELFYPSSLLETGWDIIFFWVARMVFFGRKLTGQVPFKDVFCHAMVRDAHGRKMSKSLGNVIDPVDVTEGATLDKLHSLLEKGNLDPKEVAKAKEGQRKDFPKGIPECGTDALRFTLCNYTGHNRDINMDIARVEGYRKFCNKLWNATRFALMKLGDNFQPDAHVMSVSATKTLQEKWILNRLNAATKEVNKQLGDYNFSLATGACYKFWLNELCDVYIESIKPIVDSAEDGDNQEVLNQKLSVRNTLYTCLEQGLRLLHPFMPFVTEELYQRLGRRSGDCIESIMISPYPEWTEQWEAESADKDFEIVTSVSRSVRSIMQDYGLKNNATVYVVSKQYGGFLRDQLQVLKTLCFAKQLDLSVVDSADQVPHGCVHQSIGDMAQTYLMIKGSLDIDAEIKKLQTKMDKLSVQKEQLVKKMNKPEYSAKVRKEAQEADASKMKAFEAEIETIVASIQNFERINNDS
ncbi:hypothetical protein MIR68_005437 [Amoeboaphelidium protococcarum]|nr:hypothetical protein MIR68_005437 [Amoeboaphelidium protococcarum]